MRQEIQVGTVTHYFGHAQVAAVDLTGDLAVGDTIRIVGHTTDFTTIVESMQIDHAAVEAAGAGEKVGIHVPDHVRPHDEVMKIVA
jgi:translation elongation factor EF-Tu-like GTPase